MTTRTRLAFIVALGLSASCYKDPDVNKIACRAPEYQCPGGYTCKMVSADVGRCCKSNDVNCAVTGVDGSPNETPGEVGQPLGSEAGAPIDGQGDRQQVDVTRPDGSIDTSSDLPLPGPEVETGGVPGTGGTGASDAPGTDTIDAPLTGTGGIPGSGGAGGTGGTKGSDGGGGSSGGAPGSGGVVGSGGIAASGGAMATGGVVGTGGIKGTGGATTCQSKARDCTSSLDNDCNGTPDNQDSTCVCPSGTSGPCPGNNNPPCKSGTRTCILSADKTSTAWSTTCVGQVLPAAADTCSRGNDANCNLVPNEGCQCINEDPPQACPCGTQTCTNGKLNACVTTCTATQTCSAGQCVCNTGLTPCNGVCVNLQSDPNNCGACTITCGSWLGCSAGQCGCTASSRTAQCAYGQDRRGEPAGQGRASFPHTSRVATPRLIAFREAARAPAASAWERSTWPGKSVAPPTPVRM